MKFNLARVILVSICAAVALQACALAQPAQITKPEQTGYNDYEPDIQPSQLGQTWTEIDGVIYGAKPDATGPIGGGKGYMNIVTGGDFVTSTVQSLMAALAQAKPGQTVFIPGDAVLDMTTWIIADKKAIMVPAGVTLASNRGFNGSSGALIFSDELKTQPMIRVMGDGARVTGLRLRGPDPLIRLDFHQRCFGKGGGGHALYYKLPNSDGIQTSASRLEVDNCEIMGWSSGGVSLIGGKDHHVHHNYIHHNRRHGLGYGVVFNQAFALVDYNLFDYCRHHIAGTGRPESGYEAANNVILNNANSHLFDMHGGRDRKDGTTIAGTRMNIHHNTFMHPSERILYIRGIPQESADVHHNWIYRNYDETKKATLIESDGNTKAHDNVYGNPPRKVQENYKFEKPARKK
ncbi:right-handed parallel beta-helix repeat-containing protein [bacterium]|nr:right-handed parallel beta-helix repeat-containing protein [bacterium]